MSGDPGNKRNKSEEQNLNLALDFAPVGILTFDHEFKVTSVNQSFRKFGVLYRLNFNGLENSNLADNEIFDIRDELYDLKGGLPFEKFLQLPSYPGKKNIILLVKAVPLFQENIFSGGILVLEDLNVAGKPEQEDKFKPSQLEGALGNLHDLLFVTDSLGYVKYFYGKQVQQLPLQLNELIDSDITSLFPDPSAKILSEQLALVKEKRLSSKLNLDLRSEKKLTSYECRIEPVIDEKGKVSVIFLVLNEISGYLSYTSRLEAENRELTQFRELLEEGTDGIILLNKEGDILFWNHSAEELFVSKRDEVLNTFIGRITGINKDYFESIKEKLAASRAWETTINFTAKNGERKIINTKFSRSKNSNIFLICTDITVKTLAEQELQKSEEMFRSISVNTGAVVLNINPDGTIIYSNPAFAALLHLREEDVVNKNIKNFVSPDASFPDQNELKAGSGGTYELTFKGRRGKFDLQIDINPVFNGSNTPIYYNLVGIDITRLRKKESDLEKFRSVFENARDGIAVEDQRTILLANEAFASIFGYSAASELAGKDILDLVSSTDILKAAEYFQNTSGKKEPYRLDFVGRKKDGTTLFVEFTVSLFTADEKVYRTIIGRDITERKKAQQSIRESEEKYRNITDNIDDFLYTYENKAGILSPAFYTNSVEKVTGYSPADFLEDSKLFLKIVHPDDFGLVKNKLKNLFKSRLQLSEEFEFRIIHRLGNIVWVRNKINISRYPDKKIQKIFGLVSDITLRKRAEDELKISTGNLIKLNETKDKFISIISHDLRTPFSSILGFTDLLLSDESLSENEKRQYVNFIRDSSKSMLALVNSLLDWTRLQTGHIRFEPKKVMIASVLQASVNALKGAAFQKNIQLLAGIDTNLYVFVDSNLVMQVFNNLVSNAIKFTGKGGKIEIYSRPAEEIRFVEFVVKDNGVGIHAENLNKLFKVETKFTSEGTAGEKGSGLGLSLVKEIIEKHGGTINVHSTPGKGSEFHFTLPVAPATILLVDDSKTDKLLYSKILNNITPDYEIQIASNGREAMDIIERTPPALVISDHLMPVMDGIEFVQTLKKSDIHGKPPVIILSSELDRHIIQDYTELGIEYVFQKPVNLINFKQAVEKSLRKGLLS